MKEMENLKDSSSINHLKTTVMKKSFFYSIAAILALAACSKEADVKVPTGETVTIIASVDQTRSTESHASFSWVAGEEQISVGTSDAEYVTFDVTNAENGLFAHTFTGETPQLLVAVSPVQENAEFVDGSYEVELPSYYVNYDPSKGVTNALMIGTPDPSVANKFNFRHAASLLKLTYENVPVGVSYLRFKADKNIAGTVILEGTDVSAIEIANTNEQLDDPNASDEVYVYLVAPVSEAGNSLTFYVPVPTGSYSRLEIALGNTQGDIDATVKVMDRTNKTPLTLARGDVFNFPTITLSDEEEPIVENFSSSKATTNNYDCNSSLSTASNLSDFDYTWSLTAGTGTVFENGIKLGKSGGTGAVTSPDILEDIPAGSSFTVKVYAAVWKTDGGELVVTYNDIDIQKAPANNPITTTTGEYSASHFTNPAEFIFTKTAEADALTIASSAGRILIDKVEIVIGGTPEPVQTITITPASDNPEIVPVGGAVLNFTVTTVGIDSWDVASSNSTDFAAEKTNDGFTVTVSANAGYATRSATITVTGGTKTATVIVNQAANVNSIDNPYTVAEALSIIDGLENGDKTDNVYTAGTITEISEVDIDQYKNATYTISTGESSIIVFRGKYLDNTGFTSLDEIRLGDVVVIYGKLQKYVDNNDQVIPEIAQGNYIAKFTSRAPYFTAVLNGDAQISHTGGTKSLVISANVDWTASIDNNATLKISGGTPASSISGTEDATVTVSIPETTEGKTYTISFTTTSTEITAPASITIAQSAAPTITDIAVEGYTASYSVRNGTYSFDGKVYALYSDDTRVEIPAGEYSVDGTVDLSTEGEYELTVSYQTYSKVITISVINMEYQSSATLASWVFTQNNYPSNKTNFVATSGVCSESTFYLNGSGSTWNTNKGYAFTAVTDVTITVKAVKPLKAGSTLTLSMDTYYNKASNAPMKGFNITAKESDGSAGTSGLSVTSWSLSTNSENKSVTYTVQNDVAAGSSVVFILTQTGMAGGGQGYINNINAAYSAAE